MSDLKEPTVADPVVSAPEKRLLRYRQVAKDMVFSRTELQMRAPEYLPSGAHHTQVDFIHQEDFDRLVASIRTYMLTENGGPDVTESELVTFRYTVAKRPWWIPRFLWAKLDWEETAQRRRVAVTVRPVWKYPEALQVFELGQGLQGIEVVDKWEQDA